MSYSQRPRIEILLDAYGNQSASAEEIRELFHLLENNDDGGDALKQAIMQSMQTDTGRQPAAEAPAGSRSQPPDAVWTGISCAIQRRRRRPVKRIVLAGAVLLVTLVLVSRFVPDHSRPLSRLKAEVVLRPAAPAPDVAPGTSKAVLILSGGEKIWLDSARNGSLAEQGNTKIVKLGHGLLAYTQARVNAGETLYNSVETPRGGQYRVRLPDGTGVWLNASSSLRFPTRFSGPERRVELQGEAYFEVAKDAGRPFRVRIGETEIKVLGTHFNVMGYSNEKELRTTLLEGKVDVTLSGRTRKLMPGKVAVITAGTGSIAVQPGNTEQAVAWKNGLFRFHETGIRAIMRQLERWYDVDVEFQSAAKDQDFTGVISRAENLSAVLQTLELTGTVHFKIVGKKVIVLE